METTCAVKVPPRVYTSGTVHSAVPCPLSKSPASYLVRKSPASFTNGPEVIQQLFDTGEASPAEIEERFKSPLKQSIHEPHARGHQ
jgi:hypothetical protein